MVVLGGLAVSYERGTPPVDLGEMLWVAGYFIASDNHRAKTDADAFFGNQSSWYSQASFLPAVPNECRSRANSYHMSTAVERVWQTQDSQGQILALV